MHVAPKMYLEVLVVTPVARRESRWSMELEEKGKQIVGIKLDSLLYLQQDTDLFQQFFAEDFDVSRRKKFFKICHQNLKKIYPVSKVAITGECIESRNLDGDEVFCDSIH